MKNDNPLENIFIKHSTGKLCDEINNMNNIPNFFKYIKDDKINNESKIKVLEELNNKIKKNRLLSEFFSEYNNKSIYLHLFDLYTNKNTNDKLKLLITSFIEELCNDIQTGKDVYEYIFQNLAKIYRKEIKPNSENVYTYLKLLGSVLGENDNLMNPKNYFSCGGNGKFILDLNEKSIYLDYNYSFTININFKICEYLGNKKENVNLIKIIISEDKIINIDLKPSGDLIIKNINDKSIKKLVENEWNNLIINFSVINKKFNVCINLNGEKENINLIIKDINIEFEDKICNIEFFNNFFGEVTSIYLYTQTDSGESNIISTKFLSELKKYREGLWKQKIIKEFFQYLKTIPTIESKAKMMYSKSKSIKTEEKKEKKLYDNLLFVFTPLNYYRTNPNEIEDVFGKYYLLFSGNIKNHQYQNYQKKLLYVCELSNFFPIAEMFLIHPETLSEKNFELFLQIISNLFNYRKHNLKNIKNYKFFNILSMFFEKYPQKIFTGNILNSFFEIGKTLFVNNLEIKSSNYFKHILLNEKILSKYDSTLQNDFWNKLYLFYESDKTQAKTILNINRLCLILRFYDRNKYTEMCCQYHLDMIKDEYKGSNQVMNPPLNEKLSNLKNLMDSIIDSQEPESAISLFKLLTLDLSPCLVKFIINIFIKAFKTNTSEEWNKKIINQLLQVKFEVIIINTFSHSLPDIRIELLKFVFQIHLRLLSTGNTSKFNIFEKMLKTCLLPDKKFYIKNITKKPGMHIANPPKKKGEGEEKEEPKNNNNTNNSNSNNNNNEPKKLSKSNFSALLSKFEAHKQPSSNSNTNNKTLNKINVNNQKLNDNIPKKNDDNNQKKIDNNQKLNENIQIKNDDNKKKIDKVNDNILKKNDDSIQKKIDNNLKIKDNIQKNDDINQKKMENQKVKDNIQKKNDNNIKFNDIILKKIDDNQKKNDTNPKINENIQKKNDTNPKINDNIQKKNDNNLKVNNNVQKKNEAKEENPFIKALKTMPKNISNNNNNEIKKEDKKINEIKTIQKENNIKEGFKAKINKFNEEKKQEKKPVLKQIKEQNDNIENRIRTNTMAINNQTDEPKLPMPKKSIYERANFFKQNNLEKKNTAPIPNVIPKKNEIKNEIKSTKEINNKKDIIEKKSLYAVPNISLKKNSTIEIKDEIQSKIKNSNINNKKNDDEQKIMNKSKNADKKEITEIKTNTNDIKNNDKINIISSINDKIEKDKNIILSQKNDIKDDKNSNINSKDKNKSNDNINNINYNFSKNETIIKDKEINDYINQLYLIFELWSTGTEIDMNINNIIFENLFIQVPNVIGILFYLSKILKDKKQIINSFETLYRLLSNPENCYEIFFTKKNYGYLLDLTFDCYKKTSQEDIDCFNIGKNILVILFINSFIFCEKQQNLNPGNEVETLFLWGDHILEEDSSNEKIDLLSEFLYELFFEFLLQFKLKYEISIKIDFKNEDINFKNFILKNYLMLITENFNFVFRYKIEKKIHYEGLSFLESENQKIEIPKIIIDSLRIKDNKKDIEDISQEWLDFPLIYDIFNRYKFIWVKNNVYKSLDINRYKNDKSKKYNYIIENLICNKDLKNLFKGEITLLCFEEKKLDFENIIPLTKIISFTIMCILEKLKTSKNEQEFYNWLKDLKCLIRFCIIASSNLFNKAEFYKQIQENSLDLISTGLFFLKNLYDNSLIGKTKIMKSLSSLFLLLFKLIKWNYNYKQKHSGVFNKILSQGTNDFSGSAGVLLFNEYIKDSNGNPFFTKEKLDSLHLDDNSNCISEISKYIESDEFTNIFWENKNLKNRILTNYFSLNSFKKIVDYRYELIPCLQESYDVSYKNTILDLLPQYETELAKYSNNNLEKNIRNKNKYKTFKKNAFSWRGYWSNRENFFCENPNFKYKLINHYTKNFMKPLLVPILDISYYLPEFSGFNKKNLFRKELPENKINLDIDKVLKSSENYSEENIKEKNKEKKKENYLVNIYKKSNLTLYEKYEKIANNLEFGKEEEFAYIERDTNKNKTQEENKENTQKYFLSCLVKTSHHIKGVCFIDDNNLNFKVFLNQKTGSAMSGVNIGFTTNDDDYDPDRKTCFGSYFICHPKDKDLYKISINYNDIKWIFKRKYYYTNSAFEIYTTTNKTFYFNLKYEKDRDIVLNEILKKIETPIPIIDDLKEGGNTLIGYENKNEQIKKKDKIKLSEIIKKWKNWEIDNFKFLMWLNIFGNRSYNDLSQYPIFPWILAKYTDPLQETIPLVNIKVYHYRDLNLPLGMMTMTEESKKRREKYLLTYETLKDDTSEGIKPYLFGTSYSNPFYVSYYLIRLFPFSHISIELQGKSFDNPNRLFLSVENAFHNSISQTTDVKEIIPEFFYLPEMFLNINDLNMGITDKGNLINDVITPCNNNPYDFIMTMRSVLENDVISYSIKNWADLVFGYKSRGKEAEAALNLYTEASYQESVDISKVENKSAKLREVEFGLIPNQIMIKECIKKDKKENVLKGKEIIDNNCSLKNYVCKAHNEHDKFGKEVEKNLIALKFWNISNDKILVLYNNNTLVEKKINISTNSIEDTSTIEFFKISNKMSQYYHPIKYNSKIIQFSQKGKILILGGFYDGKVQLISTDAKIEPIIISPFKDTAPIVSITIDQEEEFAFFGNTIGNISIFKMDKIPSNFKFYQAITHQMSSISYIECNNVLNLWASASIDGYINLYTLPLSKLIRMIKVPTNNLQYVFLCESPLPIIIAITEENNFSEIFVYSINGKLLFRHKEEHIINSPVIIKDINTNNHFMYILKNNLVVRSLPNLNKEVFVEGIGNIYSICSSEDIKMIFGINKSGNEIYVIKDDK